MDSGSFFDSLKARLIGHKVTYRRLACDSLLLFIDCEPGDETGVTLWFEPIWHYCAPTGVLVGSTQVAEAALDSEETMAAVADEPMAPLLGRSIQSVVIEPPTFDLMVTFEGGYYVKTSVSDPASDESWHIRDNTTHLRLKGSPRGLSVVSKKARPQSSRPLDHRGPASTADPVMDY